MVKKKNLLMKEEEGSKWNERKAACKKAGRVLVMEKDISRERSRPVPVKEDSYWPRRRIALDLGGEKHQQVKGDES
jgi:hypothetical protein